MRPQTKETRSVLADVLNEQMEKFLKRLESHDYAPSGVLHYRRRLSEFCAQVKASRMRLAELNENRALELLVPVELPSQKIYSRFMVRNFIHFRARICADDADLRPCGHAAKGKALARVAAPDLKPGRYRPDDALLAFLESL
jgi:hypothetical protein